jgi:hypothetical protein
MKLDKLNEQLFESYEQTSTDVSSKGKQDEYLLIEK